MVLASFFIVPTQCSGLEAGFARGRAISGEAFASESPIRMADPICDDLKVTSPDENIEVESSPLRGRPPRRRLKDRCRKMADWRAVSNPKARLFAS